jgi:predicted nucleic acid-binding protein
VRLLLERRRGTQVELAFLADVRAGRFRRVDDLEPDLDRIAELVERHADLHMGTVDAPVVALTEQLELREVATLDRRGFRPVSEPRTGKAALGGGARLRDIQPGLIRWPAPSSAPADFRWS